MMNTRRCPKCGSERLEKKTPPASIREHLESVISPTSGLMLSAQRRRFGVECLQCGFVGVVRVHGIMSRVFMHLAAAAVLVGLMIFALAALWGERFATEDLDLTIFMCGMVAALYLLAAWVIHRVRGRRRRDEAGSA